MNVSQRLKDLLMAKETLVMPDAYDPISARIIEQAGFKAVQCSGYSFSVAACRKQEIDIGPEDNVAITARIVEAVSVPVMADGEDGFGGIEQIPKTIERYVKIGTAGINLEDQILDGKPGTRIVDSGLMEEKIRAARNAAGAAGNPDLVINGRTDALRALGSRADGLKEAIRRGNLYQRAGADLVFVTGVSTLEEVRVLVREIHAPVSIAAGLSNNLEAFSINDLKEAGVARVSLPSIAISASIKALLQTMEALKSGVFTRLAQEGRLCSAQDIGRLLRA
ncbi:MAG: isocitrate lyase/PEP mutase family protein [Verrucomicrobiota bacterium]